MSKGDIETSPAQAQYEQNAVQMATKASSFWMPIQQFYSQQTQANDPGLEEQARGRAASTARTQGLDETSTALSADSARGASAGSGRYITDMARGLDTTGADAALSATTAQAMEKSHYVRALQDIIGMNINDQATATSGLGAAAQTEQAYAEQQAQFRNNAYAGLGQLLGGGLGQAAGSMGGMGGSGGGAGAGGGGGGG